MTTPYADLFSRQAVSYAQFRPTYPETLYERIFDFAQLKQRRVALDIATGNGQAAAVLAQSFDKVIAIDQEPEQLRQAMPAANITYQQVSVWGFAQASAESTGVPSGSVDLVTVAQAMHWFDLPAFYLEVRRVLQPGGALAAWGYDLCTFPGNEAANAALHDLYADKLGPYWADRRRLIERQYEGMEPSQGFGVVERAEVEMTREMSIKDVVGYVQTWSSYASFRSSKPDAADPVDAFSEALLDAFDTKDVEHKVTVVWPIFVILAK